MQGERYWANLAPWYYVFNISSFLWQNDQIYKQYSTRWCDFSHKYVYKRQFIQTPTFYQINTVVLYSSFQIKSLMPTAQNWIPSKKGNTAWNKLIPQISHKILLHNFLMSCLPGWKLWNCFTNYLNHALSKVNAKYCMYQNINSEFSVPIRWWRNLESRFVKPVGPTLLVHRP